MKQVYSIVASNYCSDEAQRHLKTLKPGDSLVLVREPDNKVDKNAIAVYAGQHKVGYIPKAKNAVLAQFMDQSGRAWTKQQPVQAMDSHPESVEIYKAVDAVFKPSPNSAFPQVEVE